MTTVEMPISGAELAEEQINGFNLARQPQDWSGHAYKSTEDAAMLSDSSTISGDSSHSLAMNSSPVGEIKSSDRTPICRFFKHGELIRKPTLSKTRKRKTAPAHKKEIFGSPFNADYFAKPLGTGLSLERGASRDARATKGK